jgi:hypothetical protein
MKTILYLSLTLLIVGCKSISVTYDNSESLLASGRVEWLSENLSTNEFEVFASYMEEEVLPTVVELEKNIRKLQ